MATTTASATTGRNWRRGFFFTVEITFAVIAATGEGFMYAAYLPAGPERWPEAIARATISQFIIILFGVAAIEALRIRNLFMRSVTMLAAWGVTIGASLVTFWFLLDAARVFRDGAMLAPLKDASITLPNGAVVANSTIDIVLVAALPFFQTALNILAPIITADHAPESLEQQQERQAREEAQAAHKARMAGLKVQGWGAAIGGGIKAAKAQVTGDDTTGYDDAKARGSGDDNHEVTSGDTAGYDSASTQTGYGAKAPVSIKRGQWTSRQLKEYAHTMYRADVTDIEAARAMSVLSEGRKQGNAYVASSKTVKAWVDRKYSAGYAENEATGTHTH